MEKLFSTKDVHPRDRFAYWHDVACKHIVDHNSRPECRQGFEAEFEAGALGDVGVLIFENSPMAVSHAAHHISRARTDDLFLCRQLAGRTAWEQESHEVVLGAGDMTLIDPMLPYAGKLFSASRLLVLKIPHRLLECRVGRTREMVARSMTPLRAENSLTSSFLAMLPAHTGKMTPGFEAIVKEQTLDLVAVSLARTMEDHPPRVSSARALALVSVRAVVEARLIDPALDAETVAAAAGISVRYANSVLAQENTSIIRLIQARRLAHCRKALEDPLQAHRSVSEIAYGWGFSDMTHFGRRFKQAYGVLPSEYRRKTIRHATTSSGENPPR
jgi:AraC family transcriptional activator of tynA and feaB